MDISTLIDQLLNQIGISTTTFSTSDKKEVNKILKKAKGNLSKVKKNLSDNNKINRAKKLYLVDINKKSLRLAEDLIDSFSKEYGISKGRILFAKDLKTINSTLINGLDSTLEQVILNNMTSLQFTSTAAEISKTISNQIGKSIRQTELLLEEALTLANRNISNLIYKNIETNFKNLGVNKPIYYEYAGVKDSRNSQICSKYVGQVKTRARWEALGIDFVRMAHFGCRHGMEIAEAPKKAEK